MNLFEYVQKSQKYTADQWLSDLIAALDGDNPESLALQFAQWDDGVNANGKLLGRYSKLTEILSGGRKRAGEPFDLNDTGAFRGATHLNAFAKGRNIMFDFDSSDGKTSEIQARSGDVFGLTTKRIDTFVQQAQRESDKLLLNHLT